MCHHQCRLPASRLAELVEVDITSVTLVTRHASLTLTLAEVVTLSIQRPYSNTHTLTSCYFDNHPRVVFKRRWRRVCFSVGAKERCNPMTTKKII